jgi:hypothetical protein
MSSINILSKRLGKLTERLNPSPRIIDCTGAQEDMLATLAASMTEEDRDSPYTPTPEDLAEMDAFDAFLGEDIKRIEREQNVRFVSYDI